MAVQAPAPPRNRMFCGVAAAAVALGVAQLAAVPFGPAADARTHTVRVRVDLPAGVEIEIKL